MTPRRIDPWNCPRCTHRNTRARIICECCYWERRNDAKAPEPPPPIKWKRGSGDTSLTEPKAGG